jgi:hypothetical protein
MAKVATHMNTHFDLFAYIRMKTSSNVPINVHLCFQLHVDFVNPMAMIYVQMLTCLLYIPSP